MLLFRFSRVAALAFLAALSSCQSGPPHVEWTELPAFRPASPENKKVCVYWKNAVGAAELDRIGEGFIEHVKAKKYTLTDDPNQADYIYFLSLRYFGLNGKEDYGQAVVAKAGDVTGGFTGWVVEGQGPDMSDRGIRAIQLDAKGGGLSDTITGSEWVLELDLAVGEREPGEAAPPTFLRREGRLVAYLRGHFDRQEAIDLILKQVKPALAAALP